MPEIDKFKELSGHVFCRKGCQHFTVSQSTQLREGLPRYKSVCSPHLGMGGSQGTAKDPTLKEKGTDCRDMTPT